MSQGFKRMSVFGGQGNERGGSQSMGGEGTKRGAHSQRRSMSVLDDKEDTPLLQLPVTSAPPSEGKPRADGDGGKKPHALLGIACVAASALSFSLMTTCIKYDTYSMTSMEAVFWRSFAAFLFNYVRFASVPVHC